MKRRSLWFSGPGCVEIHEEEVEKPQTGQVLVQARLSGISPGTELLFFRGQVPEEMVLDETIDSMQEIAHFPFKYGYSMVGEVIALGAGVSPDWLGKRVFCFHPHESAFLAEPRELMLIPDGISWEDAVFLPNMETAVNFVMDGAPLVGETVAIFGLGIVGLLTMAVMAQLPVSLLIGFDPLPSRRQAAVHSGAGLCLDPREREGLRQAVRAAEAAGSPGGVDLTFECSGAPAALDQAIGLTGFDGRIVIGSWYGKKPVTLDLGGKFHRSRIRLISSQVTTLAPVLSGRWTKQRRFKFAWEQLRRIQPARWITHRFSLDAAQPAYQMLADGQPEAFQVVFEYEQLM
jgi:2-desacetyl-2-hydroxyethyl bacteriochlorophyllide A dehydrogenase